MTKVQILGTGCPKCKKLADHVEQAVRALDVCVEIEKVTDIKAITGFGVMMTPALAIDGEVKIVGRVPSVEEIKALLG